MGWKICLALALVLFLGMVVFAALRSKKNYKSGRWLTPLRSMAIGVVMAGFVLLLPLCYHQAKGALFQTLMVTVFRTMGLFLADGAVADFLTALPPMEAQVQQWYSVALSILLVAAPLMTFGFVLSFFKNLSAYHRYWSHFFSDVYVFSELNEKSVALAESLQHSHTKGVLFAFADVYDRDEEAYCELLERAKVLNAVFFRKDVVTIDFSFHSKKKELIFFTMGEDETENVDQALQIIAQLKHRKNTSLYVLSTRPETEMLLSGACDDIEEMCMKVRRVNSVRSLIYRTLYSEGYEKIYATALPTATGEKEINAVVLGLGRYGSEMVKALSWFCQMDGYHLNINVFDQADKVGQAFRVTCPELMAFGEGEESSGYTITIHDGVQTDTIDFETTLLSLPTATYVFVAMGDDERNVAMSLRLRSLYAKNGQNPVIQSVVYNSDKKAHLSPLRNFKGQDYDIDFIGDRKTSYSEEVLLHLDLEERAKERHKKWGDENSFWKHDYYYKSSVASVIHRRMKILCGISGADKEPHQREEQERWALRRLEHRRWCTFMRSEGYSYSPKLGRNDLAKTHDCLVPFDQLSEREQEKDDN